MERLYHYKIDRDKVVEQLNKIMEAELAGVVRYTHYSLMVFGHSRIPIVSWFREQSQESLQHAEQAGELVTHLGGHPSLGIGTLLETHQHDIRKIMEETLETEFAALTLYYELLEMVKDKSVPLEEYARQMIHLEEMHLDEVDKMLRKPGDTSLSQEAQQVSSS